VAGFCESAPPGSDGGMGSALDGGGGGDGPLGCANATTIIDDFADDERWDISSVVGCLAEVDNGRLEMRTTSSRPPEDCRVRSLETYALNDRVFIEAAAPGTGSPEANFGIQIGDQVQLFRRDAAGLALMVREPDGTEVLVDRIEFDSDEHQFWAFRPAADGSIHWETSPEDDAQDWVDIGRFETRARPTTECIRFELSITGAKGPGTALVAFDNLNFPPSDG